MYNLIPASGLLQLSIAYAYDSTKHGNTPYSQTNV